MKKQVLTRREVLAAGVASVAGLLLPGCSRPLPPTYGNILRMGDALTYAAHRALLPGQALAREYNVSDISSFPATGTTDPSKYSDRYGAILKNAFADWKLTIDGLVSRPGFYTLDDLKRFPARKQITRHTCEEGWTAIAEWNGVTVRTILESAGMLPSARYVNFHTYDDYHDCFDMLDALHPQTILAYGMNGRNLPVQHGAPVRLRIENQVGYKSLKYVQRIEVVDKFDDFGEKGQILNGWSWYVGI